MIVIGKDIHDKHVDTFIVMQLHINKQNYLVTEFTENYPRAHERKESQLALIRGSSRRTIFTATL